MKRLSAFLLLALITFNTHANDSWNEVFGGSIKMMDIENESVQMKNETVRITMYEDYYEVDATFYFYNHGEDITLKVGFPEGAYGIVEGYAEFLSFTSFDTFVNGVKQNDIEFHENRDGQHQKNWYVKEVFFPSHGYTETKVIYTAPYGQDFRIEYDFSTGYNWFDNIDESRFILIQKADIWPMALHISDYDYEISPFLSKGEILLDSWNDSGREIANDFFMERASDGKIEIKLKDLNPSPNAKINFTICKTPFWDSWIFNSPLKIPYGFNRMVDQKPERFKSFLNLISQDQLRLLRNYFFASKGYSFKSQELTDYYSQWEWYEPQFSLDEITLSENEKDIVNYIRELEAYLSE